MAKKSSVNKNNHRRKLAAQYAAKRKKLKGIASDLTKPSEERFAARLKLSELPRNSVPSRIRTCCEYAKAPSRASSCRSCRATRCLRVFATGAS